MELPLVINLFGGACAGKSTVRAGIFHELKTKGVSCEEAIEWIKYRVYAKDEYSKDDQIYIFAKQRKILREIGNQVDVIICDSPILLSAAYDTGKNPYFERMVTWEFDQFHNVNYFINRVGQYDHKGRYQNENEAKEYDRKILGLLNRYDYAYHKVAADQAVKVIIDDVLRLLMPSRTTTKRI